MAEVTYFVNKYVLDWKAEYTWWDYLIFSVNIQTEWYFLASLNIGSGEGEYSKESSFEYKSIEDARRKADMLEQTLKVSYDDARKVFRMELVVVEDEDHNPYYINSAKFPFTTEEKVQSLCTAYVESTIYDVIHCGRIWETTDLKEEYERFKAEVFDVDHILTWLKNFPFGKSCIKELDVDLMKYFLTRSTFRKELLVAAIENQAKVDGNWQATIVNDTGIDMVEIARKNDGQDVSTYIPPIANYVMNNELLKRYIFFLGDLSLCEVFDMSTTVASRYIKSATRYRYLERAV